MVSIGVDSIISDRPLELMAFVRSEIKAIESEYSSNFEDARL